ncbi:hypothetical protein K2173_016816 [Erythroxylum novogranatense]|uniref:Uncharacterized protein n=1 Tax=Erythroxylum novogranatense TaxID=1862640 RepID=A0AAV8SH37_9ROSI|nr:hypothetical protein K2173_016816 [Erythroxylum novogranatense]
MRKRIQNRRSDDADSKQRNDNRRSDDADNKKRIQNRRTDDVDSKDRPRWNFKSIMEDISLIGASHLTWKERKELENRKVVSLGGKPPKKQRLPLSVARVQMKKQKEQEKKMVEESLILGRFGGRGGGTRKSWEKRKPEDTVLRSTEGHFRHGVLDVKHLLNPAPSRGNDIDTPMVDQGKKSKKKGSRKSKVKKKGGGRSRR